MVSKCSYIKKMIKDEVHADKEYTEGIKLLPDYKEELEEARKDEGKHSDMFRKMGMKFNCDIEKKED